MRSKTILLGIGLAVLVFISGTVPTLFLAYRISMDLENERELDAFDPYMIPDVEIRLNLQELRALRDGNLTSVYFFNCMRLRTNLMFLNSVTFEIEERDEILELVDTAQVQLTNLESEGLCPPRGAPLRRVNLED